VLNVIKLLIQLLLGFREQRVCLVLLLDLPLIGLDLGGSLLVHLDHLGLAGLGLGHSCILLFLIQLFLLDFLFFRLDDRCVFDAGQFGC
jgi:hypothetical protein